MLAARARGTKRVDLQVSRVDVDLDLLGFGHYGYSYGRGVYAALCLCLRHALYAVHAAFKFKAAVRPLSLDGEAHFLHTAQLCFVGVQHLIFPASRFGIHRIHAEQTVRKQGGFFAARAASDLHNDAPVIIFILGQQQDLKPFLQKRHFFLVFFIFSLRELFEFSVQPTFVQHFLCFVKGAFCRIISVVGLHDGRQVFIVFHQAAVQLVVVDDGGVLQLIVDLVITVAHSPELCNHIHNKNALLLSLFQNCFCTAKESAARAAKPRAPLF